MLRAYNTPVFETPKADRSHSPHRKACRRGDTTTLHTLMTAAAFKGRGEHRNQRLPSLLPQHLHAPLGVAAKDVSGPMGYVVKKQEDTVLLSSRSLAGTPLRVSLPGLGGRYCSERVRSVVFINFLPCLCYRTSPHCPLGRELKFLCCDPRLHFSQEDFGHQSPRI